MLKQICQQSKMNVDEFLAALPNTIYHANRFNIEAHTTGALQINGIFARDQSGNHLSKAGIKFASQYFSSGVCFYSYNEIKKDFNQLDKKSQILLQKKFSLLQSKSEDGNLIKLRMF